MKHFAEYQHQPDKLRALRILVQIGTIQASLRGKYFLPDGRGVLLNKKLIENSARCTVMYGSEHKFPNNMVTCPATKIHVIHGDCLESALWLKKEFKCNPVCLNMASRSNPGGGYRKGSGAQEENLHRRTTLFNCLDDPYLLNPKKNWSYPLPDFGGIYAKDCVVFRRSEEHGYAFMEEPELMSFVCVFAYSNPPLEANDKGELRIGKKVANDTKKKIETIFNIAKVQGHDSIILSAFGCGAYGNPPKHMAELFKEVISSKFSSAFSHIVFSIYDDHNTGQDHNPDGNLNSFAAVFGIVPSKLE
uniref:Microbial-type PARG catalytic domain-containing protein n=1 Tax=Arcella intermedia TaxID=1963864 RepID=A0A6B2LB84_9EUKA